MLVPTLIREASDHSESWSMRLTLVFIVLKISECEYPAIDGTYVLMLPFKNCVPHLTSHSSFEFINILSYTVFYHFYFFAFAPLFQLQFIILYTVL